jgi:hypothetical protein
MKSSRVLVVSLMLIVSATGNAGGKKPPKPASSEQNSYMMGRIWSGIEDEGAGSCCLDEALRKLEYANDDINKLDYPANTRWMAHYWYAKVLLEKRKSQKAGKIILLAQQDAQSLSPKEQNKTQQLAQEIQAKNP